ncbi:MAG: T9SS type A sorting domain-containing protein [candidate division WOR-3 bacterium]
MNRLLIITIIYLTYLWGVTLPAKLDKAKYLKSSPLDNSIHTPQPGGYCAIDSCYVYSMWTQIQENLAYNPNIAGLEFVCANFGSGSRLDVSQTDNEFSFSLTDLFVYQVQFGAPHYPTAIASGFDLIGTGPHISFAYGWMTQSGMAGQFEIGGWWSSNWDTPVDLGPGEVDVWWNIGKQLPSGNLIFIGVTREDYLGNTRLIYRTYSSNLSTMLAGGQIHPDFRSYWGFDINGGIAYVFYYDSLLNIYYRATTDGVNWSPEQVYNIIWPEPFDSNLVFWTQAVVMDNGEPKLIFDNIDYQDYIQDNYPFSGKIYVSPGSGQICREISTGLTRNFYPTIASGGNYLVGLWHSQTGPGEDSLAFWNLYYNYSTDGGLTWHTPRNITGDFGYRHGLAKIAKRIDTQNNQFFYVFGQDMVADLDPIWMCWRGWQYAHHARWYWGRQAITGISEEKKTRQVRLSLNIAPNPVREDAVITYTLLKSGDISIKIYTIDGRLVRTIDAGYRNAGRYTLNYSFKDFNSGMYIILFENGKVGPGRAFVVAK